MQIKICFVSDTDILLPSQYNHLLQGFIYNNIDDELAEFLHDKGYVYMSRNFKLFTYSKVFGKIKKINEKFNFGNKISLVMSSPIDLFCKSIANSMLQKNNLILGQNHIKVEQIQIIKNTAESDEIIVRTLSPIVTYSTLLRPDNSKYTCYFMPGETDFERIIYENLIKKCMALNNEETEFEGTISIKPIGNCRQQLVKYKDFVIKGAVGKFLIKGDKRLLQMGLDAGFGGKNSQGFGCVSILDERSL